MGIAAEEIDTEEEAEDGEEEEDGESEDFDALLDEAYDDQNRTRLSPPELAEWFHVSAAEIRALAVEMDLEKVGSTHAISKDEAREIAAAIFED